ncbi:MAG TPA: glycosyltransferase family 39 protein [Terriglobales bacterium]|nr:glycosyltransferase family 39 protein [Terriglobales bacterium]
MALLAGGDARKESVTIDEVPHIGAGVSYLQKLDMRMNEEHPPLAKLLAALPLVLRGVHADYSDTSWTFSGQKFFNEFLGEWSFGHSLLLRWNPTYPTLWWARVPMLGVTLLLGFVLYYCGSRLGGSSWSGLLCLAAYVTTPTFLAFGPLVITDIVVTLFWVLATWQLPRIWESPSRGQVFRFGLILAGAFLSKFSSGLFFFVFPAVALSLRLRPLPLQPTERVALRSWRRRGWRNFFKAVLWASLVVYVVYLVFSWNEPTTSFSVIPHFPRSLFLRRALMPIWIYLRGLAGFALSAGSRPAFILGHTYSHGVWFYFPVLFLLKSQLAFLLLLCLAAVAALAIKTKKEIGVSSIPPGMEIHWRCVWISLAIFIGACLLSRLDISIRHFTIPLALIILLLAPLPRTLEGVRETHPHLAKAGIWGTFACATAAIVTALVVFPYYLPFTNVLSLHRPRYLLFSDSNVDWNQSLYDVGHFARQRGLNRILLDEYGFSDPQTYVPQAQLWDCQQPSSSDGGQWAVVSANLIADGSNCRWLLKHLHWELSGGSMYAVLLPDFIPPAGSPSGPPRPQDYRYFGGMKFAGEDARQIFLRCSRDANQLQPTLDKLVAEMTKQRQGTKK